MADPASSAPSVGQGQGPPAHGGRDPSRPLPWSPRPRDGRERTVGPRAHAPYPRRVSRLRDLPEVSISDAEQVAALPWTSLTWSSTLLRDERDGAARPEWTPRNLAGELDRPSSPQREATLNGVTMVHISTEYADGTQDAPWRTRPSPGRMASRRRAATLWPRPQALHRAHPGLRATVRTS